MFPRALAPSILQPGSPDDTNSFPVIDGIANEIVELDPENLVLPESSSVRSDLRGAYRRELYDTVYGDPSQDDFRSALVAEYRRWVSIPVYVAMEHRDPDGHLDQRVAVLGAKRGNGPYRARVKARVRKLHEQVKQLVLVKPVPQVGKYPHFTTNALFLTLTCAPRDRTLYGAWKGPDGASQSLNRVLTMLRGRFGPLAHVRAFESHKNGYPHVHVLVVFMAHEFLSYDPGRDQVGRPRAWVQREDYGGEQQSLKSSITRSWGMGNVSIDAVRDPARSVEYIMKYIVGETKGRDPETGEPIRDDLTMGMTWFWNLRSFGASHFDLTLEAHLKSLVQLGFAFIDDDVHIAMVAESGWTLLGVFELLSHEDRPPPWSIDLVKAPELAKRIKALERERRDRRR